MHIYIKNLKVIRFIIKSILFIEFLILTNNFSFIKSFFLYLSSENEFKKIELYLKICIQNKKKSTIIYKNKKPKISIISPVFNREKYISRFINCIQKQIFNNIEIIFIDDNSLDNSARIIEKYQKEDSRIILIKNKKNKGTLISRNLGVLYSKGKYIILPDPDDIISKSILYICNKYAEKYKYELIRFNVYKGNRNLLYDNLYREIGEKEIYQPDLKLFIYYGKGELEKIDSYINNKYIKKEVYIKVLNFLSNFYLNLHIIYGEDLIMTFALYIVAKSFYFLKEIGYFYITNANSITKNLKYELRINVNFILLKFVFDYCKNTKYEFDITNLILNVFGGVDVNIIKKLNNYNNNLSIYYNIVEKYINYKLIPNENKKILKYIKYLLKRVLINKTKYKI